MSRSKYTRDIAKASLKIEAIKLSPGKPFQWASGYQMPIYNDNRMFLFHSKYREMVASGFMNLLEEKQINFYVIAGTSTAGISPATTLADALKEPLIYVRDKPKSHGLKNQIEGIDANSNLRGRKVVLVEDLISTGGSSVRAVQAIRNAGGRCNNCISIFDYGFDKAVKEFGGLNPKCNVDSLLTYGELLEVMKDEKYFNKEQIKSLEDWGKDPWNWGEKHGFPKVEK